MLHFINKTKFKMCFHLKFSLQDNKMEILTFSAYIAPLFHDAELQFKLIILRRFPFFFFTDLRRFPEKLKYC